MTARPYTGIPGTAPAPTSTPSPSTLNTLTAADLAFILKVDLPTATHLYGVAVNMVEEYAPRAPSANKAEAIYRFSSYLLDAAPGTKQSETFGPKTVTFTTNHGPAFRNSGAAMVLTRYKRRRAGAI